MSARARFDLPPPSVGQEIASSRKCAATEMRRLTQTIDINQHSLTQRHNAFLIRARSRRDRVESPDQSSQVCVVMRKLLVAPRSRTACRDRQGETVRLRDALKRLFSEVLTEVNLVLSLAPIPFTIAMMASTMPAAIRQSSTAATPDSPVRNLQNIFIEPSKGVELFVGVKPEEALKRSGKIRPILLGYG